MLHNFHLLWNVFMLFHRYILCQDGKQKLPNQCHKMIKQYLIWFCTVCWCFIKSSKAIWVKGIFKLCFRCLKMAQKKSKLSLHRRKRKAVIVSPFKRYETELPMNGCSPFKSPWHKHKRIIKSPGKAPTFSPYKSPLIAVRYSPKQSLMRNKNRKTSAKSLFSVTGVQSLSNRGEWWCLGRNLNNRFWS